MVREERGVCQQGDMECGRDGLGAPEWVSQARDADGVAFARAAAALVSVKHSPFADAAEPKPFKSIAEQRQAIEARRQEKRVAAVAAVALRRKRLKVAGAEDMAGWLRAGARGTAEVRDACGAPTREQQHRGPAAVAEATRPVGSLLRRYSGRAPSAASVAPAGFRMSGTGSSVPQGTNTRRIENQCL